MPCAGAACVGIKQEKEEGVEMSRMAMAKTVEEEEVVAMELVVAEATKEAVALAVVEVASTIGRLEKPTMMINAALATNTEISSTIAPTENK